MEAINNKAIGYRTYYKLNKEIYNEKIKVLKEKLDKLIKTNIICLEKVTEYNNLYIKNYGFHINNYEEYKKNNYIDNKLFKDAQILFNNDENNKDCRFALISLVRYSNTLKLIKDTKNTIELYTKIVNLTLYQYTDYLREYYKEVEKQLILNGYGYDLGDKAGFLVINRCKIVPSKSRKKIDFNASRLKKQQLIEQGEELFNAEKAAYCKKKGIEYNAKDHRVYLEKDYTYEWCLCYPKLTGKFRERFYVSDYRGTSVRGKSNQDIINEVNGNVNKVFDYDLDPRTKLNIILEIDKSLAIKFKRNDEQKPFIDKKSDRKD